MHQAIAAAIGEATEQVRMHALIVGRPSDVLCHSTDVDFSVQTSEQGARTVVTVVGDLDVHTAPVLQEQLGPLTARTGASVIVDLAAVGFVDSTGLGILVGALKHVREVGGRLDAVVSAPRVLKVFSLTGLDAVIPIWPSLDAALAAG